MKVLLPCWECLKEGDMAEIRIPSNDINDDFLYIGTCERGHQYACVLQMEKFELLFDHGCISMLNGNYRDAVTNISTALERFFEFFIRVVLSSNGVHSSKIDETWARVKRQSERQLGAFYLIFLNEFQMVPPVLSQKNTEIRNDVIHGGIIPSRETANTYAKAVFDYIMLLLSQLQEKHSRSMFAMVTNKIEKAQAKYRDLGYKGTPSTISQVSLIGLNYEWNHESFEKRLEVCATAWGKFEKTAHG